MTDLSADAHRDTVETVFPQLGETATTDERDPVIGGSTALTAAASSDARSTPRSGPATAIAAS
jgi:hypothetical protein